MVADFVLGDLRVEGRVASGWGVRALEADGARGVPEGAIKEGADEWGGSIDPVVAAEGVCCCGIGDRVKGDDDEEFAGGN